MLFEDNGNGVSLLASRAAYYPDSNNISWLLALDQLRKGLFFQEFKSLRLSEKTRDSDKKLFEKLFDFVGIFLKESNVIIHIDNLVDAHPPFDSAVNSTLLVEAE